MNEYDCRQLVGAQIGLKPGHFGGADVGVIPAVADAGIAGPSGKEEPSDLKLASRTMKWTPPDLNE